MAPEHTITGPHAHYRANSGLAPRPATDGPQRREYSTIARAGKPAVDLVAHRPTDVVFGVAEWRGWRVDAVALDAHDEEIEEMFYGANP